MCFLDKRISCDKLQKQNKKKKIKNHKVKK